MSNNNNSVEAQGRRGHRSGKKSRDPLVHINIGDKDVLWDAADGAPWDIEDLYVSNAVFVDHNYGVNLNDGPTGEVGWYREYDLSKSIHLKSTFKYGPSTGEYAVVFYICGVSVYFTTALGYYCTVETSEYQSDNYFTGDNIDDDVWRTAEVIYEYLTDDVQYVTVLLNGKHMCKVNVGGGFDTYPFVGAYGYSGSSIYIRSMSVKSDEPWKSVYVPHIKKKKDQIFILINDNYVDYVLDPGGNSSHEANNLIALLDDNSITYQTFTDISESEWGSIVGSAGYILIPELERGEILPDMSSVAKSVIGDFVGSGGKLIMFCPSSGDLVPFLNDVFSFSIIGGGEGGATEPINITVDGSALFPSESSTLPSPSATSSLDTSTLPADSVVIYEGSGTNQSVVTKISYGSGIIYVMGWDWYDAAPLGVEDGGWLHLLESMLQS